MMLSEQIVKQYPPPWTVNKIELHEGGYGTEIVAANGEVIANNQTYYSHALDADLAPLIAAAPELLVALINVERYMIERGVSHEYAIMIEVRKAIAKATTKHE